jgi:hypothetical protein
LIIQRQVPGTVGNFLSYPASLQMETQIKIGDIIDKYFEHHESTGQKKPGLPGPMQEVAKLSDNHAKYAKKTKYEDWKGNEQPYTTCSDYRLVNQQEDTWKIQGLRIPSIDIV